MNKSELASFCQVVLAPCGRKMRDGGGGLEQTAVNG